MFLQEFNIEKDKLIDLGKLEEEIANVMHGIDSDLDDAQANMYHDDYDGTTRLTFRFVCSVDKISDKTRKTIINALEKYLNSTKFNQFIYIQLYPIKVPVGASYEVIINAETEPKEINESIKTKRINYCPHCTNNTLVEIEDGYYVCDECGHEKISYNSCRNRHCPMCQSYAREKWIQKRIFISFRVSLFSYSNYYSK